jgi:hypothetical protein
MSLPLVMETGPRNVPATVPYLHADPDLVKGFATPISGANEVRVGLAWAGNPQFRHDRFRSTSLARLSALAGVRGVHFFSLQKGAPSAEAARPPAGLPLTDLSHRLNDFADTAAAMANLDLVISTCTSVAHLAGVMGRPLWVMLSTSADWRWPRDREDNPWYPTARLFRQPKPGDWEAVAEKIAAELNGVAETQAHFNQAIGT